MNRFLDTPAPGRKIVIVEDESILALDMERSLKAAGYEVLGVAADSESALALVEQQKPDLVLMDIRIQGAKDGIDTARQIKDRFDMPFVYLTAHSDPNTIQRAQATEPMGYLVKPFKKPDLQNVVNIALVRSALERKLKLREELLSTTLRCIGEAIISSDAEGHITYANAAAELLFEAPAAQLLGRRVREVLALRKLDGSPLSKHPLDEVEAAEAPIRFEGTVEGLPHRHIVAGTAAAVRAGPVYLGVVLAIRDVTELLLARQQLEFSERLAALGTLAAGVAHEVNNPLSVVLSNVGYVLEENGTHSTDVAEALADARDAAERVAGIVEALRDFSRPQVETLRVIDPREAIGAALQLTLIQWRKLAGVVLDLGSTPAVMAAPARLVQVFVTLIINATQAMEQVPGQHVFTVRSRTDDRGWAVLSVADDGPGVQPEVAGRIFDPFFTTKEPGKGTGLGLSVARSIVEHHKGELRLDPAVAGRGAVFSVSLPPTTETLPVPTSLDAWWVGPATTESERICPGRRLEPTQDLTPYLGAEVIFLGVTPEEDNQLRERYPELEARGILVTIPPPPGIKSLRPPFDVAAVTALVRRGRQGG